MMTKIESMGIYLPEKVITTTELLERCNRPPKWDLEKVTGISERRISENETSLDISVGAVQNALAMSKYKAEDIDMIVCASLSRYSNNKEMLYEPSQSLNIRSAVKADNAEVFDIVNACAGLFTGVVILDSFIKAGVIKCGIVVTGEQGSELHESALRNIKHSFDGQLASLTLGDCGAAIIMDASADEKYGFHLLDFITGAKYNNLCIGFPSKKEAATTMITKPVKLHKIGLTCGLPYIKEALDKTGWHLGDVDYFIPHQTAARTIKRINKYIYNFAKADVRKNSIISLQKYGNTATTSHYLALHDSFLNGTITQDNNLMFLIGASGLIVGNATYTIDDLPDRYKAAFGEKAEDEAFDEEYKKAGGMKG